MSIKYGSLGPNEPREGRALGYRTKPEEDRHPLYFFRTAKGLSLKALAGMIGSHDHTILDIERGDVRPGIEMAFKLALALETTVDKLFGVPYKRNAREELAAR